MKKNTDYSFIASRFDGEGVVAPDNLSLDNIVKQAKSNQKIVKLKSRKKGLKAMVSIAACIAVVVCSVMSVNAGYNIRYNKADNVISFSSYAQINALIRRLNGYDFNTSSFFNVKKSTDIEYAIDTDAVDESTSGLVLHSNDFSETNRQVDAVDEADVVKTDGKYIYYLNRFEISIYTADGKNSEQVGLINSYYSLFDEMYIVGDRLIAISGRDLNDYDSESIYASTVQIYDITDRSNPVLENEFSQSGSYTSSRMIGDYIYLVSSYYVESGDIPRVIYSDEEAKRLSIKDIYCMPCPDLAGFVVVSAININDVKAKTKSKAILGCSSDIYCSENNLYLLNSKYDYSRKNHSSNISTNIIRIALDGEKLDFNGKATVSGNIESQYSLDERDGYLRVATTDFYANNLYILDNKMKQVGKVEHFAQEESIKAVRYIGNYAYVITYEETDPLFIIDVSDVSNPRITGNAKITGFSDNLIPVDENTILGIGYAEDSRTVKLALFDVTKKNNPKVLDSRVYNYESEAQHNIKALLINKKAGYFAFAYETPTVYDSFSDEEVSVYKHNGGVVTFEVENSKINETNDFKSESAIFLNRCVYVNDNIYALTVDDEMLVLDMSK